MMKRLLQTLRRFALAALVAAAVLPLAFEGVAEAKFSYPTNHPDLQWMSIETEHFVVHYPVSKRKPDNDHYFSTEWAGRKVAKVAEEMWPKMCAHFNYYLKERIHIVLLNQADDLAGFTIPPWDWIEISANPGYDFYRMRGRMEWFSDVLVHEFAHVVSLKSYATHVTQQAVVQAIQDLKRDAPLEPRAITRVIISGAPRIMEDRHAAREPHDVLGGQYSLPFTTAVALTRDMSDPLVYDADAVADPIVRDLARRIELVPLEPASHETPGFWPAEIVVECGGRRHTRRTRPHKGSPGDPFTWDEAVEKFRRYTASILDARQAAAIVGAVAGLEQAKDMSELAGLLAGA